MRNMTRQIFYEVTDGRKEAIICAELKNGEFNSYGLPLFPSGPVSQDELEQIQIDQRFTTGGDFKHLYALAQEGKVIGRGPILYTLSRDGVFYRSTSALTPEEEKVMELALFEGKNNFAYKLGLFDENTHPYHRAQQIVGNKFEKVKPISPLDPRIHYTGHEMVVDNRNDSFGRKVPDTDVRNSIRSAVSCGVLLSTGELKRLTYDGDSSLSGGRQLPNFGHEDLNNLLSDEDSLYPERSHLEFDINYRHNYN